MTIVAKGVMFITQLKVMISLMTNHVVSKDGGWINSQTMFSNFYDSLVSETLKNFTVDCNEFHTRTPSGTKNLMIKVGAKAQ